MAQSYRILVVDNSPHARQSVKLLLRAYGYQVSVAADPAEARRLVGEQRIHLALVDIRLEDDDDPYDTSGLELAADLDPIVARIIITGYPSYEHTRRALGSALPDSVSAAAFIAKQDDPVTLLSAIERVCREKISINWNLKLEWEAISAEAIGAEVEHERIRKQVDLPREVLGYEVEELLRKLFHEADHVIVAPLLPPAQARASSQSGAVVLKVQPRYKEGGWGVPVVCKVGARRQIEVEADNYERHVKGFISGHRHTNLDRVEYTHHLGGILYSMLGTTLDAVRNFQDFYRQANVTGIGQVLDHLFKDVCHYWYANRHPPERLNLTQLYQGTLRLTDDKLQLMLARHFPLQGGLFAQFEGLPGARINPIHWIRDKELECITCRCVTHGDLHSHNIFVDAHQQVWLIDFGRTGEGHVLRDFIELETDIKFALMEMTNLKILYDFEVALLGPDRLDNPMTLPEQLIVPDVQKAFQVIRTLRNLAARVVNSDSDARPYYQGLLYQTLNVARLKKINAEKQQHALLSAALICERLDTWG
jgi:CheY-like chemotaxis protein